MTFDFKRNIICGLDQSSFPGAMGQKTARVN